MWRRLGRDELGSVVSLLVVVPVLVGTVALGVETGQFYQAKRQMQGAADAAALAGSLDRIAGKDAATIEATARYEAQRNGFQNAVNGVTVTVNSPPTSGANISTAGAVEVIVTKAQSYTLGAVLNSWLGVANNSFQLRSRSVAAQGTYNISTSVEKGCMVALTTANEQGVRFTSFNNFNSDCMIVSNGTSTSANSNASVYMASFNNASLESVWTRGRFHAASYNSLTPEPSMAYQNQTSTVADPYAGLPEPAPRPCDHNPFNPPAGSSLTV